MSSHHHSDQRVLSRSNLPSSVQRVHQISFSLLLFVSCSAHLFLSFILGVILVWFYYYSRFYLFITYVSTFVILLYLSVFDAVSRCTLGAGVASSFVISGSLHFYFVCWSIYFYFSVTSSLYLQKCCRILSVIFVSVMTKILYHSKVWVIFYPNMFVF